MKRFAFFASVISVCSINAIEDLKEQYREGDRFFTFPGDGDHRLHRVDSLESVNKNVIKAYASEPNHHGFGLYTRSHPTKPVQLIHNNVNTVESSDLDINKTTVFLVHGWLGNGGNEMNQLLTEAFLENDDVNVIVFDWSKLANQNYVTAKEAAVDVGEALGSFVQWLGSLGLHYDSVHLVGFSLGGHVVGSAGRHSGSLVKRITGLDPAGPLWRTDKDRLRKNDAQYVEIIHTNTNMYGYPEIIGDADFFPNGGTLMPGCWVNACSHSKAYEYMAASVKYNNFYAHECKDLNDVRKNKCNGDLYPMGNSDLNKSRSGIFRVNIK